MVSPLTDPPASIAGRTHACAGYRPRLRPTRLGLLFGALLACLLVGSINYANNLAMLMTFWLASIALVSVVHSRRNLSGLRIRRIGCEPAFAGASCRVTLAVQAQNRTHHALRFMLQGIEIPPVDIDQGQEPQLVFRLRAEKRGILSAGPLRVSCLYPLGLVAAHFETELNIECLVYPKPQRSPTPPLAAAAGGAGEEEFWGLRPYVPGDPLKSISWRASSRGRGIFTKEFQEPEAPCRYLDWTAAGPLDPEQRLAALCYAVLEAHAAGGRYSLILPGRTWGPGRGPAHRDRCLKALALFPKLP